MLTRRDILQNSAVWAISLGLEPLMASQVSRPKQGKFFVLINTFGGMDVTLGLDPWVLPKGATEKDLFLEYREEETLKVGNIKLGPAAASLKKHAGDCAVINGVMMRRDAGHDVVNAYMTTGRGDGKAAHFPVELVNSFGGGPFGVISDGTLFLAGKVVNIVSPQELLGSNDYEQLIRYVELRKASLGLGNGTHWERAHLTIDRGKKASREVFKLIAKYKAKGAVTAAQVTAACFLTGCAAHAQLNFNDGGLDSHQDHVGSHLAVQKRIWERVSAVFDLFKSIPFNGKSLFDATTFAVTSEWSRTPALNAARGKDHNPFTNSILLSGRGIKGGTVIGASRLNTRAQTGAEIADHIAKPFNFTSGQPTSTKKGASFIYPENIVRTLAGLFGDRSQFHAISKDVPIIPGLLTV